MYDGTTGDTTVAIDKTERSMFTNTQPSFLKLKDEALNLKEEDIGPVHLSPGAAGRAAVRAAHRLAPHEALIAQLPRQKKDPLTRLRDLGLGTIHAHLAIKTVTKSQAGLPDRMAVAFEVRDEISHWVKTFSKYGLMPSATLDNAEGGTSREKVANDIMSMSDGLLKVWDDIAPQMLMTKEAVHEARVIASDLMFELTFEGDGKDDDRAKLFDMRRRFFAMLKGDYRLVKQGAIYMLGDILDVDALIPPFTHGGRKKASTAVVNGPGEGEAADDTDVADAEATSEDTEVAEADDTSEAIEAPDATEVDETSTEVAPAPTETAEGAPAPCGESDSE